jgi:NADH:ubiquinone oxidoreductase subunit E
MLCGSTDILKSACDHLGIKPSETTKDGLFTVIEVECQGACSNAPMMVVNDDFYVSHCRSFLSLKIDHRTLGFLGRPDTFNDHKGSGQF